MGSIMSASIDSNIFVPTEEEEILVQRIFNAARLDGDVLPGDKARPIFQKSLLSNEILKTIWDIADEDKTGRLSRERVGVMIRLIGYAQVGIDVTEAHLHSSGPPAIITDLVESASTAVPTTPRNSAVTSDNSVDADIGGAELPNGSLHDSNEESDEDISDACAEPTLQSPNPALRHADLPPAYSEHASTPLSNWEVISTASTSPAMDETAPESSIGRTWRRSDDSISQFAAMIQRSQEVEVQRPSGSNSSSLLRGTPEAPVSPFPVQLPPFPAFVPNRSQDLPTIIRESFPEIEVGDLVGVVRHQFKPIDLHKLGPRKSPRETSLLDARRRDTDTYPNFSSLMEPLQVYFNILIAHASFHGGRIEDVCVIATSALAYTATISRFAQQFASDWSSVLKYHLDFHEARQREMADGIFYKWGVVDEAIFQRCLGHLVGPSR